MSIIDFSQIGERVKKNQADIAIVVGFILVAIIAFGAGRLTAPQIVKNPILIDEPTATSSSLNIYGNVSQPISNTVGDSVKSPTATTEQGRPQGLFVASKGGKKYHWPWCSWGERIKEENKIWFNSEKEAQTAGYSPCACIQSRAPVGYARQ
jgi:hypothetical protein